MSEKDEGGNIFKRLLKGFSGRSEKTTMNDQERKAEEMAQDLRDSLGKVLPKLSMRDRTFVYDWTVRTSMQEIINSSALDSAISEFGPDEMRELAERTGKSEAWLRKHYRESGNEIDTQSVRSAYVIVEAHVVDQDTVDPYKTARKFIHTVHEAVGKHNPDQREIVTDQVTALSQGRLPEGGTALFDARYSFRKR